ncbi:protein FAM149B1-like isoform X2 [Physella acuta]|uniref:protein FAM149B1-like isoform X2 n=1 Tax=Physella acuta TaxID=109671 RepID=UPI0027DE8EBD|nr:protein FAM149B1-like isoform X2 [Physella acuta]
MTTAMLQLEVVGSSPRTSVLQKFSYLDRQVHTPTRQFIRLPTRRGLARTPLDDAPHPLEHLHDTDFINRSYDQNLHTALISNYDLTCSSGVSTPTVIETQSPLSYGGWTTGYTTERSSLDSSYFLDDFDKHAASTVSEHFDKFESMLFEGPKESGGRQAEVDECKQWSDQFPHLRVLGKQAYTPKDLGYCHFPSHQDPSGQPTDTPDSSLSSDSQGLMLTGRSVVAKNVQERDSSDYGHLLEEVLAEDGNYEDVIAVDYSNVYEDSQEYKKQITPRKRRVGYPPITPNACVKDSVTSSAFDQLWQDVMTWLQPLLIKYSEEVSDSKPEVLTFSPVDHNPPAPDRQSSFISHRQNSFHRSNTQLGSSTERSIDGILQISSIPLMHRFPGDTVEPHLTAPLVSSPPTRPMSHVRQSTNLKKGRLLPLPKSSMPEETSPTPATSALRVKRINLPNEGAPSPPVRHGTLPPLDMERTQKKLFSGHRASSAIDNKDVRLLPFRERPHILTEQARPNTTHAMRLDSPFGGPSLRRSSTPLGNSIISRNNLMANKSLDVRGSSLQHSGDVLHYPDIQEDQQENPEDEVYKTVYNVPQTTNQISFSRNRLSLR